ncbi:MAG: hypothetical protein ACLPV2_11295, partial [Steroidobacteraceae bacterium]
MAAPVLEFLIARTAATVNDPAIGKRRSTLGVRFGFQTWTMDRMNTEAPSEGLRQGSLLQDHTPMMQQ